jgi:large conductance mechanosensitive channel
MRGFKRFLLQGDLITIAVGFVVALAFSTLIRSFTTNIITPLINAAAGGTKAHSGLGWTLNGQRIDVGSFVGSIIYFVVFMAAVYFLLVVPYRAYMARRGKTVFGEPPSTKTCPECLSNDLPQSAIRCLHCGAPQRPAAP